RLVAGDGYEVVLVARSEAKLREIASSLGVPSTVIVADLADPVAPRRIADELRAKSIDVDALVNNAGLGVGGPFAETDLRKELELIHVNIVALTHLPKLVLPGLIAPRRGRVRNAAAHAAGHP